MLVEVLAATPEMAAAIEVPPATVPTTTASAAPSPCRPSARERNREGGEQGERRKTRSPANVSLCNRHAK